MHKLRGWDAIGYHVVISREGMIAWGEDPRLQGAHALGVNMTSIAVCMVGGVDEYGAPANNFTSEQWVAAKITFEFLSAMYPGAENVGHRDLSEDRDGDGRLMRWEFMKDCPCFSVKQWIDGGLEPVSDLYAPWEVKEEPEKPVKKKTKKRSKKKDMVGKDMSIDEAVDIVLEEFTKVEHNEPGTEEELAEDS
jgi:hypothetical protein